MKLSKIQFRDICRRAGDERLEIASFEETHPVKAVHTVFLLRWRRPAFREVNGVTSRIFQEVEVTKIQGPGASMAGKSTEERLRRYRKRVDQARAMLNRWLREFEAERSKLCSKAS